MKKILSTLLAIALLLGCFPLAVFADETVAAFAYEGSEVAFIKEDGSVFGMFTAQEGTKAVISGDTVQIHFVPKNETVYGALYFGAITDTLKEDITFNSDGTFDIELSKEKSGKAWPVAPIKKDGGGTTSAQYYLAIPAEDKLEVVKDPVKEFAYSGDSVSFIKEDGTAFGMLAPQEGSTAVIQGKEVLIHIVPKNAKTYGSLYFCGIDEIPTEGSADVTFNEDGTIDLTLPLEKCEFAWPIAPIKKDGSGTTSTQYYLAIPAADKLPEQEEPRATEFDYAGDTLHFIKEDGSDFGMWAAQEGTTYGLDGDNVVIHFVPKNKTTYKGFVYGDIRDIEGKELVASIASEVMDFTVSKEKCGKAWPIAPIKTSDGTTTSTQYYMAIPAEDKLSPAEETPGGEPDPTEDVTYADNIPYTGDSVNFIKEDGSAFGMWTAQEGTTAAIDGEDVAIHFVPKNTSIYKGFYFGDIRQLEELTKGDLTVTLNEDGSMDFKVSKSLCGNGLPVVPVKTKDGATTGEQYYLAIPAEDKLSPAEEDPQGGGSGGGSGTVTPETPADQSIDLKVTNEVRMFKVNEAKLVTKDGSTTLVVTLNGSGYHNLYKGTYDEAKATGYKPAKWIEGELNKDQKYEFSIPVTEDETYLPIVAISQTYVDKYLAKENKIERAFFPRQFTLDAKKKTLLVEDYEYTQRLKVSNKTDLDASSASLTTVGGPNSNEYGSTLKLTMKGDTYTKAYIGTAKKAASAKDTVAVGSGDTFELKVRWVAEFGDPDSVESYIGEDTTFAFYNSSTKKWEEFTFDINEKKATLTVMADEEAEPVEDQAAEQTPADGAAAASKFIDVKDADWFDDYANKAAENGLMTGYAAGKDAEGNDQFEFRGKDPVTRAMFVTILSAMNTKLKGEAPASPSAGFADVKAGIWYEKAVDWAFANGVAAGRGKTFGVDDNVSRQDMAVFMYAYAKKIGKAEGTPDRTVLDKFADAGQIADYAKDAMAWLVSSGLMAGRSETSIAPLAQSSRAEISAFAVSCFDFLSK